MLEKLLVTQLLIHKKIKVVIKFFNQFKSNAQTFENILKKLITSVTKNNTEIEVKIGIILSVSN